MPGTEQVSRSDDQELVASLRAGDEQAFAALVDAWSGPMLRLARGHVPTDSAAEDVVQETWMAVLRGLDGFRGRSKLRTWVFRILVNQAKTRGSRERRSVPSATLASEDGGPTVDPSRFRGTDDPIPAAGVPSPRSGPSRRCSPARCRTSCRRP
jgi:RNA polymerase sigma-70 factor (ECF subfamily)